MRVILLLLVCITIHAEHFSSSNVQYLYGSNFESIPGDSIDNAAMSTVTLEHFGTWDYGSNYFFVDLTSAAFESGKKHHIYGEFAPSISLSRISDDTLSFGVLCDLHVSAQINQGDDFQVLMAGGGVALCVPGVQVLKLDAYVRKDTYNQQTFQSTLVWSSMLTAGVVFKGFADYYGIDDGSILLTQPQLLVSLGIVSETLKAFQVGTEVQIYGVYTSGEETTHIDPQVIAIWNW